MPKVDLNNRKLIDNDGRVHELGLNEFWYIVPNGTKYNGESKKENPCSKLGVLLHNAHVGEGIVPAMTDLLKGIDPQSYINQPYARKNEDIFERIRLDYYPNRPSRLRCHFLSLSRKSAEKRLKKWNRRDGYIIVSCYLILSSGIFHYANIKEYEKPALNRVCDERCIENYAHKYWQEFVEGKFLDTEIEVLADSALYFPDWKSFPMINLTQLI